MRFCACDHVMCACLCEKETVRMKKCACVLVVNDIHSLYIFSTIFSLDHAWTHICVCDSVRA